MQKKKNIFVFVLIISLTTRFEALQAQSQFSGDLMLNYNFFNRDTVIKAANNQLYDNVLSGGEAWLSANYSQTDWKLRAGVRVDVFHNSNLRDPLVPYTKQGLGTWFIEKEVEKLTITGGYFYDQLGSGITFRSFEDRGLGIDYATFGVRLKYQFNNNFYIKAFTGKMKNRFDFYEPVIKGATVEHLFSIKDKITLVPGATVVNRTIDKANMASLVSNINGLPLSERFYPQYNFFATSIYNTLNYKNISWYVEAAHKTKDAQVDNNGKLFNKEGTVLFSTLSYSSKHIGISLQAKRTENFMMRTSPSESRNDGIINFLPPMSRQNVFRLPARYQAVTQAVSELAYQGEVYISPKKGLTFTANVCNITSLENQLLYREIYLDFQWKISRKMGLTAGTQLLDYNIEVYQFKPGQGILTAITPFVDLSYKLSAKKSMEVQLMYQENDKDFGSWLYGAIEFNIAPNWSFAATDMWNIKPKYGDKLHYYSFFTSYTHDANRFTITYARQVEGIVCTGGVCRYEPAFSGFRVGITSSF
jgi:hypothetical protein